MSVVLDERVTVVDGIAFADTVPESAYRDRWEREAAEDHVRSAIATSAEQDAPEEELLTAKIPALWQRFPRSRHVGTLLDVGAGYGRLDLHLSRELGLACDRFLAVDISETMLRRLLEYRDRFGLFPGAETQAICASADDLPIADASVDLVISGAVFLHMGKKFVARAVREIARVLKPGGEFVFDTSFPNARNPSSWVPRVKPPRLRNENALKYWTRPEIERTLRAGGLRGFRVEPSGYAALPKRLGPWQVPLARRANAALGTPRILPDFFAVSYSAFSEGVFE